MNYLLNFYTKHPLSLTQDFVKLMFQAEFGCEHIMGDYVLKYIEAELAESNNADTTLVEPISDEYCRVHLSEYKRRGYLPLTLARCMKLVKSSGSVEGLQARLEDFLQAVDCGAIGLDKLEVRALIDEYVKLGCPPVRHSQTFRDSYAPHYRVIYRKHALFVPVLSAIERYVNTKYCNTVGDFRAKDTSDRQQRYCAQRAETNSVDAATLAKQVASKPLIVAIDGCCGSGKTYYSKVLAEYFDAIVIHCDDFFLPMEMRNADRLSEIGGNVHYERLAQTLSKVREGKSFTYQAYDCSTDSYVDCNFAPTNVVIVEGSYALHPKLRDFYDVKVLLTVDSQTQYDRLLNREGANGIVNFVNRWIPLENKYFTTLDTSDCLVINTEI